MNATGAGFAVITQSVGTVPAGAREYAREKIVALAHVTGEPILGARITLRLEAAAAPARPAVVQVEMDVNGHPVRAHADGATLREATDLVQSRVRAQLGRRGGRRLADRSSRPTTIRRPDARWLPEAVPAEDSDGTYRINEDADTGEITCAPLEEYPADPTGESR
jgi:hypothetical protein